MANANKHLTDELYSFTTCDILIVDLETGIELYSGKLKSHSINKASNKTSIKACPMLSESLLVSSRLTLASI